MLRFRGIGPIFVFVLAVIVPASAGAFTLAPFSAPAPNVGNAIEGFLALSVTDSGLPSAGTLTAMADQAGERTAAYLSNAAADDDADEQAAVIRHRGFGKAILIVLICGAIIRFLTSPTFLNFITDALDPKAW